MSTIYILKKNFVKILQELSWNEHVLTEKYVLIYMNMSIQDSLFDASYCFKVMIAIADIFCKRQLVKIENIQFLHA